MSRDIILNKQDSLSCTGPSNENRNTDRLYDNEQSKQNQITKMSTNNYENQAISRDSISNKEVNRNKRNIQMETELETMHIKYESIIHAYYKKQLKDSSVIDQLKIEFNDTMEHHGLPYRIAGSCDSIIQSFKRFYKIRETLMEPGKKILATDATFIDLDDEDTSETNLYMEGDYLISESASGKRKYEVRNQQVLYYLLTAKTLNLRAVRAKFNNAIRNRGIIEVVSTSELHGIKLNYVRPTTETRKFEGKVTQIGNGKVCTRKYGTGSLTTKPLVKTNLIKNLQNQVILKKTSLPSLTLPNTQVYQRCRYGCNFKMNMSTLDPEAVNIFGNMQFGDIKYNIIEDYFRIQQFYLPVTTVNERIMNDSLGVDNSYISIYDAAIVNRLAVIPLVSKNHIILAYIKRVREHPKYVQLSKECSGVKIYNTILSKRRDDWAIHNKTCKGQYKIDNVDKHHVCDCGEVLKNKWQMDFHNCGDDEFDLHCYCGKDEYQEDSDWEDWMDEDEIEKIPEKVQPKFYEQYLLEEEKPCDNIIKIAREIRSKSINMITQGLFSDIKDVMNNMNASTSKASEILTQLPEKIEAKEKEVTEIIDKVNVLVDTTQDKINTIDEKIDNLKTDIVSGTVATVKETIASFMKTYGACFKPSIITNIVSYIMDLSKMEEFDGIMIFKTVNLIINMIEDILGITIPLVTKFTQSSPLTTILQVFSFIKGIDFFVHKGIDLIKYIWSKFPKLFEGIRKKYAMTQEEKTTVVTELSKKFALYQCMKQLGSAEAEKMEKDLVKGYDSCLLWTNDKIGIVNNMFGSMRPIYESILTKKPAPPRVRPFFLVLEGKTRTGKSTLAHMIGRMFCQQLGLEESIYTRNPGSAYWDGYNGQKVVIYDDFGQSTDPKEAHEIFQVVTNNAFIPPMATISDSNVGMKGTYFTSPFIIACTNRIGLAGFSSVIVDEQALWQRVSLAFNVRRGGSDNTVDDYYLTDVSPSKGGESIFKAGEYACDTSKGTPYKNEEGCDYIFAAMEEYFTKTKNFSAELGDRYTRKKNEGLCSLLLNEAQADKEENDDDSDGYNTPNEWKTTGKKKSEMPRALVKDKPKFDPKAFKYHMTKEFKKKLGIKDCIILTSILKDYKNNTINYIDNPTPATSAMNARLTMKEATMPTICDLLDRYIILDGKRCMDAPKDYVAKVMSLWKLSDFGYLFEHDMNSYCYPLQKLMETWDRTSDIRDWIRDLFYRINIKQLIITGVSILVTGLFIGFTTMIVVTIPMLVLNSSKPKVVGQHLLHNDFHDFMVVENSSMKMTKILKSMDQRARAELVGNIKVDPDMQVWEFIKEKQKRMLDKYNADGTLAFVQKLHDSGLIKITGDVQKIQSMAANQKIEKVKKFRIGEDQDLGKLTGHPSLSPFKIDVNENKFDMQGAQMSMNDRDYPFAENVHKSMIKITAYTKKDEEYNARMSIFGIFMSIDRDEYETTYLLPGHFVDALTPEMIVIRVVTGNGYEVCIHRSNLKFVRYTQNMDMALMIWNHRGYSNINEPRSLLKHFILKSEIKYVPSIIDCVLVRFIKQDEQINPVVIAVKAKPISYSDIDNCYTGNGKVYQVLSGYTYDTDCKVGDCGSLLIGAGSFMNGKILGFHVMGSNSCWKGGSQALHLECFLPEFIAKNCITCEAQVETFMEVDKALFSTHNQRKNNFVMTNFSNEFTIKQPANLYSNEGCDPGTIGLLEHGMYQWFPKKISVANLIPLNWKKEKLIGGMNMKYAYEGFGGMDSLNMQTSAGYPFSEIHMNKKHFMEKFDDGTIVPSEKLKNYMEMYIDTFKNNKIPPFITWTVGLKDELLKPNKLARVFSIPPFTYTIACRYAFGEWISMMHNNPITTGVCVGMNPESQHWSQLYYSLRQHPYLLDGDYTKWDKRLHGSLIHDAVKIINSWYDKHIQDGNNKLRLNLIERMYNSVLAYGNKIYRVRRGMASGHVLTALINSLCNKIVLTSAMSELLPKGFMAKHALSKNAVFAIYGDDWLMTISDEYAQYINRINLFAKITELFLVGCTISTKDDKEITPFAKWEEVTFLKRRFKLENLRVVPLLEPTSIFSCLKYVRKSAFATTEEQFIINIEVATRFLYFYGKKIYQEYAKILQEYTDVPSYRELNLLYEQEGFNIMQCQLIEKANSRICINQKQETTMNKSIKNKKVSLRACILKNNILSLIKNVTKINKYHMLAIIGTLLINSIQCQPSTGSTSSTTTVSTTTKHIVTSAVTTFVLNVVSPYFKDTDLKGFSFVNMTQSLITQLSELKKDDVDVVAYGMIISMLGLILYHIYPKRRTSFVVQAGDGDGETWADTMDSLDALKARDPDITSKTTEDKGDSTIDNMVGKDFKEPELTSMKIARSGVVKSDSNITKTGSAAVATTTREIIVDGKTCIFHPIYSRPVFIKNITFGTGSAAGTLLGRFNFTDFATITGENPSVNITKNQYLRLLLNQNLYANFDILVTITINSTKLACGSFMVGYAPQKTATRYSYYGRDGKATLPALNTSLSSMFARKYTIIDTTRDGIYQMVIPWTLQHRYISSLHDSIADSKMMDYFDLAFVALTPFQSPAGAPASANIGVEATMVNIEYKGISPQQVQSKLFGNDYTTIEYHLKDINNSALPMNVTGDSFTTDIKPELGLSAFGLDNPSDTRNTTRPGLFQRLWSYTNVVTAFRNKPQPNKIITFTRSDMRNLNCEVDEMSWDFIKARENYLTTYTITPATGASTLVGALPLAPVLFNPLNLTYAALPRTGGRPGRITPTTLGIFLKEFRHWRGSLDYHIYINANTFGCGKLLVAIHYGILPAQLQSIATAGALDGRSVTHMVIDLSNPEFQHKISVPYSSVHEALALYQRNANELTYSDATCMGSLSFWLITGTGVPTGMPGNVNVVVTQKLGHDFIPITQQDSRMLIAQTSLSQPMTTRAGKILNFISRITSIKEMLVLPVSIGYFKLDNQTLDGNAIANPGLSFPMTPQYIARYSPIWNMAMTQYAGWRGSLRIRVTHLEGATTKVFWTPQRGTQYVVNANDTGAPWVQGNSDIDGFPEGLSTVTAGNDQFIMDKNIRLMGTHTSSGLATTSGGTQLPATFISAASPETIIEVADPSPMGLAHSTYIMPFVSDNQWNGGWNMRQDPRISYVTCKLARLIDGDSTATVSVEVFAGDDFRVFWYSPHILEHQVFGVTNVNTTASANYDRPSGLVGLANPA